jgi:hypothetical protein
MGRRGVRGRGEAGRAAAARGPPGAAARALRAQAGRVSGPGGAPPSSPGRGAHQRPTRPAPRWRTPRTEPARGEGEGWGGGRRAIEVREDGAGLPPARGVPAGCDGPREPQKDQRDGGPAWPGPGRRRVCSRAAGVPTTARWAARPRRCSTVPSPTNSPAAGARPRLGALTLLRPTVRTSWGGRPGAPWRPWRRMQAGEGPKSGLHLPGEGRGGRQARPGVGPPGGVTGARDGNRGAGRAPHLDARCGDACGA